MAGLGQRIMNCFQEDLAFSHKAEDLPIWEEIYRRAFPGFAGMISYREFGDHQKAGVDRGVYLEHAKEILIDEKVRRKDYGDILLEYLSNDRTGALGWACKPLRADYIAYAILPVGECHLMPVIQLQEAWRKRGDEWRLNYGEKVAANSSYGTHSCPVPVDALYRAMGTCLHVKFNNAAAV